MGGERENEEGRIGARCSDEDNLRLRDGPGSGGFVRY